MICPALKIEKPKGGILKLGKDGLLLHQLTDKQQSEKQLTAVLSSIGPVLDNFRIMEMPSDCYQYQQCVKALLVQLAKAGFCKQKDGNDYGGLWLCRTILAAEAERAGRSIKVHPANANVPKEWMEAQSLSAFHDTFPDMGSRLIDLTRQYPKATSILDLMEILGWQTCPPQYITMYLCLFESRYLHDSGDTQTKVPWESWLFQAGLANAQSTKHVRLLLRPMGSKRQSILARLGRR
jgi:hypothetical protein